MVTITKEGEFVVCSEEVKNTNVQKYREEQVTKIIADLETKLELYKKVLAKF